MLGAEKSVLLRQHFFEMVPYEGLTGIYVLAAEVRDTPVKPEFEGGNR